MMRVLLCLAASLAGTASASAASYQTTFPANESPISQGGQWINGRAEGLDWANVDVAAGLAMGTQTLSGVTPYDDSTAILTGAWGPDQTATATIYSTNPQSGCWEEVEIRLRSVITANWNRGYECNYGLEGSGNYAQVIRWNGPLADSGNANGGYTPLDGRSVPGGLRTGDVVKATISGSNPVTITTYLNDVELFTVTDSSASRWTDGNPGVGFYLQAGSPSLQHDYGFTAFTATDGIAPPALPGRVPDGAAAPGVPLTVTKSSSSVTLAWDASCSAQASDYAVYSGIIGSWYSHESIACSTSGALASTVALPAGNRYILVVPLTLDDEGSLGTDSTGRERPRSLGPPCHPTQNPACP
jgi:hypothetical protein